METAGTYHLETLQTQARQVQPAAPQATAAPPQESYACCPTLSRLETYEIANEIYEMQNSIAFSNVNFVDDVALQCEKVSLSQMQH